MNRLIEYFENLDFKNFIMLILSVLIASFIAIYYINDAFSQEKELLNSKKIEVLKKLKEVRNLNSNLAALKRKHKILKTKYKNLSSDYKFLISEIESSDVLVVDKKKFLKIFYDYLKHIKGLNANFEEGISSVGLDKYNLHITGSFRPSEFFEFCDFLKTLQTPKAIISINNLSVFRQNDLIKYDMMVTIWSFR